MSNVVWTKETLAQALNTRMDQGKLGGNDFVMINDISDDALEAWQSFYDTNVHNPLVVENEYARLYQSIVGGW